MGRQPWISQAVGIGCSPVFRPNKNCEPLFQEPVYSVESSSILGVRTTGIPSHVPAVALKASCFQAAVSGRAPAGMLQLRAWGIPDTKC